MMKKKPYTTPVIEAIGTMVEDTRGASGPKSDGGGWQQGGGNGTTTSRSPGTSQGNRSPFDRSAFDREIFK
jgi:hypothetical protein